MPIEPIPPETTRVARAAFPKGHRYLRAADELETLFTDDAFVALFPTHGLPACPPWRLALVTLLQFAEGLSDRQAANAVRSRLDGKYVLCLELTDPGFDASVLSEFRTWRHVLVTVAAAGAFGLVLLAAPSDAQMVPAADAQASVSGLGAAAEDKAIRPFHIDIPDEALADLRGRSAATRWPDKRSEPHAGRFAS